MLPHSCFTFEGRSQCVSHNLPNWVSCHIIGTESDFLFGLEDDLNHLKENIMFNVVCNYQVQSYTINSRPQVTCIPVWKHKQDMELLKCLGCFEKCRWLLAVSWMKGINFFFFASQSTKSKLNYQVIHLSNIQIFSDSFACNWLLFHVLQKYFSHAKQIQSTARPRLFFGLATGGLLLARSATSNNPIKPLTFDEAKNGSEYGLSSLVQ